MSPEDSPQCAQVSYVISQILNATVQCNLFRQARKESTIFRSLLLDTSNECFIMRCSACILHAVISAVPTGWPAVTQLYSLMLMLLLPIGMFFAIHYYVFTLYQLFFQCWASDWWFCFVAYMSLLWAMILFVSQTNHLLLKTAIPYSWGQWAWWMHTGDDVTRTLSFHTETSLLST